MKRYWSIVLGVTCCVFCLSGVTSEMVKQKTWDFEKDQAGATPKGWEIAENRGAGTLATWEITEMKDAPSGKKVFALTKTENPNKTYNLAIVKKGEYKDIEIEVKVKAMTGKLDQGGGPVWRVQDKSNYYITRWNPLENNLRLYHVKNEKRTQLKSVDIETDATKWHTIKVITKGNKIAVSFDGKQLLEAEDDTFPKAGKIGLWTKADARTAFDDLKVVEK